MKDKCESKNCYIIILCLFFISIAIIFLGTGVQIAYADDSQINVLGENDETEINLNNVPITNFSKVNFIKNSNYFYLNPKHADNSTNDNPKGTCTTVAMQLLMGYHNYYSDRRLIPELSSNGKIFLSENYGDFNAHPDYFSSVTGGLGNEIFGTEDAFFYELFDLTTAPQVSGIGQNIPAIKNAANKFVET